ncbi:MAG: iron-sulfur cluster repair di-iron protein [Blastocatellia bacterium]|nr:iron-sulfur cluster repair di-iron protein [Blastocatellia bacterium]
MATQAPSFDLNKTVRELAVEIPHATRVFEKFGIDYCCGGAQPFSAACQKAAISVEEVALALQNSQTAVTTPETHVNWNQKPLTELIEYIVDKHHTFTRLEITRLGKLIDKVYAVHGENHPELRQVADLFTNLAQELTGHLMKEEQVLFPYLTRLERAVEHQGVLPLSCFGTVANPIRMMEYEHDQAGTVLRELRSVTNNYTPPADACFSYNTLYSALEAFETDLHQHIHLENNLVHPRAKALEEAYFAKA